MTWSINQVEVTPDNVFDVLSALGIEKVAELKAQDPPLDRESLIDDAVRAATLIVRRGLGQGNAVVERCLVSMGGNTDPDAPRDLNLSVVEMAAVPAQTA